MKQIGKVWLVGAGSGDSGLLTIKGKQVIEEAEVIVYDALISLELLSTLPKDKEYIFVGKRSSNHFVKQDRINQILVEKALAGKKVVRLKGGAPFVFGRGGEELELLLEHKIPYEIVPGITSAVAVPAYAGIPVTHRDYASSFHIVTGHQKNGVLQIDYEALVRMKATLVFLMGIQSMEQICTGLMQAGMDGDMSAAVLERGTQAKQKRVVATLATLKKEVEKQGIGTPAIIVVGKVCDLEKQFSWYEKLPLSGRQIVVTRPGEQASILAKKLRSLGADAIEMPTIAIRPFKIDDTFKQALHKLEGRDKQENWCVFTSPRGVEIFFARCREMQYDMRRLLCNPHLKFAVLGSGTKRALEEYGIFADAMPEVYSAECLGHLLGQRVAPDSQILIFRAKEGSAELTKQLKAAGCAYEDIAIYETVIPDNHVLVEPLKVALQKNEIDYVTFTSASSVRGFVTTMQGMDLAGILGICIGEQTNAEAKGYGIQTVVAKEASIDSMVETMLMLQGK